LDENDLEVNLLWVLSLAIRKLAFSFSHPTHSSFLTTACDTKHNLCRLVKSMIIRDGSLSGVLLLETMWDHLAILFPALTYEPLLRLILFKNQSLWSDNQFHWIEPNFAHFPVAPNWGWNKHLSKARAQIQGDVTEMACQRFAIIMAEVFHQETSLGDVKECWGPGELW
jgi:hypothetical protein